VHDLLHDLFNWLWDQGRFQAPYAGIAQVLDLPGDQGLTFADLKQVPGMQEAVMAGVRDQVEQARRWVRTIVGELRAAGVPVTASVPVKLTTLEGRLPHPSALFGYYIGAAPPPPKPPPKRKGRT
jgi:hypothetical protein